MTAFAASIGEVLLVALWLSTTLVAVCVGTALLLMGLASLSIKRALATSAVPAGGASRYGAATPLRPAGPDRSESLAGILPRV